MNRFIYEPDEKLVRGHVVQLRTAGDVLRCLGVQDADPGRQAAAVEEWLKDNDPDEFLQSSLERMGLPVKPHADLQGAPSITEVLPRRTPASFVVLIRTGTTTEARWQKILEVSQGAEKSAENVLVA